MNLIFLHFFAKWTYQILFRIIFIPVIMDRKLGYAKSKFSHNTFQMSVHIHAYVCFGTMRNAITFSVHAQSVTSLDLILKILPAAINQSFMKNTHKLTHSSHALIHPYKSKIILKQLHPNIWSPFFYPWHLNYITSSMLYAEICLRPCM